jgi:HAD superfamily hydrolase (TIGR01509 family)
MAGPRVSGVLFDWDGVLLDSLSNSMNVYNKIMLEEGMEPLSREKFFRLQSPNWYEFYERLDIPKTMWKRMDDAWVRLYRQEAPKLQPDTMKCLRTLKSSNFRLGLISNGSKARVGGELARFDLNSFFDVVHCPGRNEEMKPAPILLQRALGDLGLQPGNAVYIGDSPVDIQAAQNAGIASIALAREPVQVEMLLAEKPDYLFRDLEGVSKLVLNLG